MAPAAAKTPARKSHAASSITPLFRRLDIDACKLPASWEEFGPELPSAFWSPDKDKDFELPTPSTDAPDEGATSGSEAGSKRWHSDGEEDARPPRKLRRLSSEESVATSAATASDCGEGAGLSLEEAAASAVHIYDELMEAYLRKYRSRNDEEARKHAEALVKPRYRELVDSIVSLLPRAGGAESLCEVPAQHQQTLGSKYEVVEFDGRALPPQQVRRCPYLWQKLAAARSSSAEAVARDALCAALAAVSARSAQVWLEAAGMQSLWESREEGQPRSRRPAIFENFVREMLAKGYRGYFSKALLDPTSHFRVALACRDGARTPASLLLTHSLPMCKALQSMDDGGPLRREPAAWRRFPHFALQDLLPEEHPEKEGWIHERVATQSLRPERAIRDLVRSRTPVVVLHAFAALAPREEARDQGLSAIVQAELELLLREARARGQGVVFMLGGDDTLALARKVYLKPPFTNYGLRVGSLRWREAARGPWAREKPEEARVLIGLQLP